MGSVHSKNGAVNEEDKKALRRENYKASTTSSDRNSHQARAEDVLSTLEQAALLAHVPNLRKAASLAISLLDVIPSLHVNKSAFKSLATDACDLAYAAMNSWKDRANEGRSLSESQEMVNSLGLIQTIKEAKDFALGQASRGVVLNLVSCRGDAKIVSKYREKLKSYLDLFGLQSHIAIREAVSHIRGQSNAILAVLTTLGTAPSNEAPSSSPSFTAFGSIVNNGEGTLNSIDGNCVVNNTTTNASSTNSGHIMNISTINANNKYDPGHGMGRRNGIMDVKSVPRRPSTGGRGRKAGYTSGQRGRSGLKTT